MTGASDRLASALRDLVDEAVAEAVDRLNQPPPESVLVDVAEVARRLSIGTTKLKELLAAGELRSTVIGRRRLIRAADLDEFANKSA
jgi:excisionase family DNA binding protein